MLIGYARVSTQDQKLHLQKDALKQAGCEKVLTDQAGGATAPRPGLERARDLLREGDTLVVWRLDRLGRSLKELIALLGENWNVRISSRRFWTVYSAKPTEVLVSA